MAIAAAMVVIVDSCHSKANTSVSGCATKLTMAYSFQCDDDGKSDAYQRKADSKVSLFCGDDWTSKMTK